MNNSVFQAASGGLSNATTSQPNATFNNEAGTTSFYDGAHTFNNVAGNFYQISHTDIIQSG
jgi:hypothetical protein